LQHVRVAVAGHHRIHAPDLFTLGYRPLVAPPGDCDGSADVLVVGKADASYMT
jgi:hypothetical protein